MTFLFDGTACVGIPDRRFNERESQVFLSIPRTVDRRPALASLSLE
jgi:hypothetical protein